MLRDFALFSGQHNSPLVRYIQELCLDIFLTMLRMIIPTKCILVNRFGERNVNENSSDGNFGFDEG